MCVCVCFQVCATVCVCVCVCVFVCLCEISLSLSCPPSFPLTQSQIYCIYVPSVSTSIFLPLTCIQQTERQRKRTEDEGKRVRSSVMERLRDGGAGEKERGIEGAIGWERRSGCK